jgi:hypothetical protein
MLSSLQFFDRKEFCHFYRQNYAQLFLFLPCWMLMPAQQCFYFYYLLLFCAVNEGMPSSINVSYFFHFEAEALRTV